MNSAVLKSMRACHGLKQLFTQQTRSISKIFDEDFNLEYLEGSQAGIAVCSFTKPQTKNAISKNIARQFQAALDILKYDTSLRVMILRSGAPGIFCAGADLKERLTMKPEEVGPFVGNLRSLSMDVTDLPIPTLCALDGVALGGGLELALCCDIRVASDSAKLGLTETKLAIIPGAGGTQRLPRVVNPSIAKELVFTGRAIDGKEAAEIGLVNHSVAQNDEGDAAYLKCLSIAEEITCNGPIALRMAKQAINKGIEVDLSSALAIEQGCYAQVIPTQDRIEGLKAFKEKRPPKYVGK